MGIFFWPAPTCGLLCTVGNLAGRSLGWKLGVAECRPAARRWIPPKLEAPFPDTFIASEISVGVGLTIFIILGLQLSAGHSAMREADQAISQALGDSLSPLALQAFKVHTHLGDTFTLTALWFVVAILLGAVGHHRLAVSWVVTLAATGPSTMGSSKSSVGPGLRARLPPASKLVSAFRVVTASASPWPAACWPVSPFGGCRHAGTGRHGSQFSRCPSRLRPAGSFSKCTSRVTRSHASRRVRSGSRCMSPGLNSCGGEHLVSAHCCRSALQPTIGRAN